MSLTHLVKGQSDWQTPVNAMIDMFNEVGGGTVSRIDSPLTWLNGATGNSVAYVIPFANVKLVVLAVSNVVIMNLSDGTKVANLPDNLHVPDSMSVRLPLTEKDMLANQGNSALFLYTQGTNKNPSGCWGLAVYLIESN